MRTLRQAKAETLRDNYRKAKTDMMFFRESLEKLRRKLLLLNFFLKIFDKKKSSFQKIVEDLPIGKVTLHDLIIGADKKLGPNQIALREFVIDQTINHGLLRMSITFGKDADLMPLDRLAGEVLSMHKAAERGNSKTIFTERDLLH